MRPGNWLQTFTGQAFYPLDPKPEEIHIADIAHHLSMICRYGGAVSQFYSVAEHSLILSKYVQQHRPGEDQLALQALLHDASEAYIFDIPRPLKHMKEMDGYRRMEDLIDQAVMLRYHLPGPGKGPDPLVAEIDERIMIDEARRLLQKITNTWTDRIGEPLGVLDMIRCLPPLEAELAFLDQFVILSGRLVVES